MIDKTWTVMNDLEDAFNQITTFSFLLEQLQEAVDAGDAQRIVDTTAALNAFYPPYCQNWDRNFKKAWDEVAQDRQSFHGVLNEALLSYCRYRCYCQYPFRYWLHREGESLPTSALC